MTQIIRLIVAMKGLILALASLVAAMALLTH